MLRKKRPNMEPGAGLAGFAELRATSAGVAELLGSSSLGLGVAENRCSLFVFRDELCMETTHELCMETTKCPPATRGLINLLERIII